MCKFEVRGIVNGFQKSCFSNAMDGTEGLWLGENTSDVEPESIMKVLMKMNLKKKILIFFW